jgi:TP901 family phage tail tape measure protein
MALEKLGVGGVLSFDAAAGIAAMDRARMSFASLTTGAKKFSTGLKTAAGGLAQLSLVGAGASLVLGSTIKYAAKFQEQMSAVEAVSMATKEQMAALTNQAKLLGATTKFTAVEAGQAQENLSRAGFAVNEVLSATPAVMNAAAAEAMDLASASEIVANVLRGMNLEASNAARVSDVLALASARSNSTILSLGESFAYAAPQAVTMGFTFEEVASSLGKISDAGLKGSLAGTAFTNMLVQITKPSAEAAKAMKDWGIQLEDSTGKILPLSNIVGQFKTKIDAIPSATERARIATELFGIRGQKAYNALSIAGPEAINKLTTELEGASKGIGAAAQMAQTRLDNVRGAITILTSAWQGLQIEIGSYLMQNAEVKEGIQSVTQFISDMTLAMQGQTEATKNVNGELVKYNPQMTIAGQVAKGIKDGLDAVTKALKDASEWLTTTGEKFGIAFGPDMVQTISKIVTIVFVAMAALAPIGGVLLTLGFAISGITSIVSGLGTAIGALFGWFGVALVAVAAGLVAAFVLIRKEGESVGDTLRRVFQTFSGWISNGIENAKEFARGFGEALAPAVQRVSDIVSRIKVRFDDLVKTVTSLVDQSGLLDTNWKSVGKTFGSFADSLHKFITPTVESVINNFIDAGKILAESIIPNLKGLWTIVKVLGLISIASFLAPLVLAVKVIWPLIGYIVKGLSIIVGKAIETVALIGDKLAVAWEFVTTKVSEALAFIGKIWDFVSGVAILWWEMVTNIGRALGEVLLPYVQAARDWIVGVWEKIASAASTAWNWITTKVIAPFVAGVKLAATRIKDQYVWMFTKIVDAAKSIFSKLAPILLAPFQAVASFIGSMITAIAGTEVGKAALKVAGVPLAEIMKFQSEVGKLAKATFGGPTSTAKAVEKGTLDAAEKSPATKAMKEKAEQQGQIVGAAQPCVTVDNKVEVDVASKLSVDGSEMAIASAKHQAEISERAGFSTTPWQKRKILEVGALPATGGVPA